MTSHITFCQVGRLTLSSIVAVIVMTMPMYGQDSEHSDPMSLDDPKDWHEAYVPAPYGVIAHGSLALSGGPEEGTKLPNNLRVGLMAYYDAWQIGLEMRPEASYIRLMPRTVGRDGYVAGVLEVGFASARGEVNDWYSGTTEVKDITETRYGMGLSARTGASETLGGRFLFDFTFGLVERTNATSYNFSSSNLPDNIYWTLQLGALARLPLGSFVINAGPYLEYGTTMLINTSDPATVEVNETYFRAGLHFEVALNLNRPHYLTGAQ
jgi:hypothetical protein